MPVIQKVRPEIMDSVALLVLDAQDSFINTLHNKEAFLKRCAFAIEAARILRLQTIFTEQSPEKLGRSNSSLYKLAHQPKVFAKHSFSALNAPGIEAFLREKEIYHLLIAGLEVPICVYQTGLQATEEDVDVTFLSDALGSRRAQDEAPVLNTLIRLGCQNLPSETVFYSLLGDAHSPYFADYNQLVKTFNEPDFDLDSYLTSHPRKQELERRPAPQAQGARKPEERQPHRQPEREPRREREPAREREPTRERVPSPEREPSRERESARVSVPVPDFDSESDEQDELPREPKGAAVSDEERRDERRSRRRGRRRRGRGRDREGQQPETAGQQRPREPEVTPAPERKPEQRAHEQSARREERAAPEPSKEPTSNAPSASHQPPAATAEPATKIARKTARKATKKVAKKATKKVAKKSARKAAKKIPAHPAEPPNE